MTAQIIEDDVSAEPVVQPSKVEDNLDDLAVAAPAPEAAPASTTNSEVPEKYAGKTIAEVIAMHQNAEQAIGRQSSEVGQLRSIVDDFIKTQSKSSTIKQEDEEEPDFLDDPKAAVDRAIANHPIVREASETVASTRKEKALNTLKDAHPDMTDLLGNPDFINWVGASKLRVKNFREANETADVDSMSEIFTDFKATKKAVKATVDATVSATSKAARKDTTGAVTGAVDNSGAKIYRRIDIMKLMQSDPDRYEAMQPEILRAYAEKRVR